MSVEKLEALSKPLDVNVSVWRYTQLWKFLDMLERRTLRLTLLDTLRAESDPYETSIPVPVRGTDTAMSLMTAGQRSQQRNQLLAYSSDGGLDPALRFFFENENEDYFDRVSRQRKALLRSAHASCWRYGEESEAMWQLYCGTRDGVAIRTTFAKLESSIDPFPHTCVSLIEYRDYRTQEFKRQQFRYDPALHKRVAFLHENEVRILRCVAADFEQAARDDKYNAGAAFELPDWDLESVVDEIIVNPLCPNEYVNTVSATVGRISKSVAGKVKSSNHGAPPQW